MSITELGALGEFVASFGVIATLVYLAIQMRQNTKALQLNTGQAVNAELQQMFSQLCSDEGLSKVFLEAGKSAELNELSRVRYNTFMGFFFKICENAFLQKRENTIGEAYWTGVTNIMIDITKMPAFESYWNDRKHWVSGDFRDFMDAEILPTQAKAGVNIPGKYESNFSS
jgi:hypothetical protein